MEIRYHRGVQADLNGALSYYKEVSKDLSEDFYDEFLAGISKVRDSPKIGHFNACGLRRCNLVRFPFHFLYDLRLGYIRIWVLRHDHRNPNFGLKRF